MGRARRRCGTWGRCSCPPRRSWQFSNWTSNRPQSGFPRDAAAAAYAANMPPAYLLNAAVAVLKLDEKRRGEPLALLFFVLIESPRPQRADSPVAGRALPVTHRPGRRIWPRGLDSPAAGRERSQGASPAPNLSLPGLTQPRTPGFTFVRTKVNRKSASPLWAGPRLFSNRI